MTTWRLAVFTKLINIPIIMFEHYHAVKPTGGNLFTFTLYTYALKK